MDAPKTETVTLQTIEGLPDGTDIQHEGSWYKVLAGKIEVAVHHAEGMVARGFKRIAGEPAASTATPAAPAGGPAAAIGPVPRG